MALSGAPALSAQQPYGRYMVRDRRDPGGDYRGVGRDYANVDRMRADIARDEWQLHETIRCGRSSDAARIARDLARDQQALDYQLRDIRRDRAGARYGRHAWR